jgi:hypothetical protein
MHGWIDFNFPIKSYNVLYNLRRTLPHIGQEHVISSLLFCHLYILLALATKLGTHQTKILPTSDVAK